jgi:hypothetical protein
MNRILQDRIASAVREAELASTAPGAYAFLPEIIESLKAMQSGSTMTSGERERLAGSLGRLVTEDFAFSEGPLGTMLLELAEQFASHVPKTAVPKTGT